MRTNWALKWIILYNLLCMIHKVKYKGTGTSKMKTYTLGEIIYFYRNQKKISQAQLCRGICSISTISRVENDEINIPMLLSQALLERVGIDFSQITLLLDAKDYKSYLIREKLDEAIRKGHIAEAEALYKEYESRLGEKDILDWQYLIFQKAQLTRIKGGKRKEILELLERAAAYTIDFSGTEEFPLSKREKDIIFEILQINVQEQRGSAAEEKKRLLQRYMKKYHFRETRGKSYYQLQLELIKFYKKQDSYSRTVQKTGEGAESIYEIGDMIKCSRKSMGITQEELAEGICSVLTLSRIENGRQSPGKKVYEELMRKMGLETSRIYTDCKISKMSAYG